jgi:hypothetical protein
MAEIGVFIGSGESVEQARGKPQAPALLSIVARLLLDCSSIVPRLFLDCCSIVPLVLALAWRA